MRMIWGRGVALVLVTLFWGGTASAQIIEERTEGGKTFTCMHTGLSSGEDCGGKVYAYSYVFIGSISGIRETGEEKEQFIKFYFILSHSSRFWRTKI